MGSKRRRNNKHNEPLFDTLLPVTNPREDVAGIQHVPLDSPYGCPLAFPLRADPYTQHSEDDSFPNHLEPIDDLLSLYPQNWVLYHDDPLEKTTDVTDPEHAFSDWSSSPDSVDSDLDDESLLSTSTYPLSPHGSDRDDEDNDHMYYSHPSPIAHDIYHLEETKYPPHLYSPDQDAHLPLPSPPSSVAQSPSDWTYMPPPLSLSPDAWESPAPLFDDYYSFNLHDPPTTIPSSPSRRTSRELPEDDEHASESQRFVRLRSLPGAETDDDLIPTELASKNYIPDPSIVVPTDPPPDIDGLLLWDLPSRAKIDLLPARSPSPEDFTVDPSIFAELAGREVGVEMQRIHELRERTGKTQSWEKERFRELSALLRLKIQTLGNAPHHESPALEMEVESDDGVAPPEHEQESMSISTEAAPCTASPADPLVPSPIVKDALDATAVVKSLPKPKITNMDQLVATMVFHRQQDALRRSAPRARTWSGPSYGNSMQGTSKTHHPTPRSPLRQVSLPSDLESVVDDEGDFSSSPMELCESPLPLSPLVLTDSPLGWLHVS